MAEDVYVHGGEYVGVDLPPVISSVLIAGVNRMSCPVRPEESALIQCQRKRVWQLTSDNHLPKEVNKHTNPVKFNSILFTHADFVHLHCHTAWFTGKQWANDLNTESAANIMFG